jgi:Relaxase/Mobilisation nuclease domain/Large polyvalent protein-associated domain 7
VIVKKVPTRKTAALKSKALHVSDLCDYIAGPNAGDDDEKVEHQGAANMLNLDHAGQVEEMADLAETARRSPQPVQHWIISWRQGEQPTAAQADEAVRIFLTELGLGEHQCVYALHRNTDNYHLHLAVNRVHPESERVVTVNGRFDIEVAHRAIARIERAQGWQSEARGRYLALDSGELRRAPTLEPVQRQPTTLGRDFENQTGQKSGQRVAIELGAEVMRRARNWDQLHLLLAEREMRFERKGSGAVLWVGDVVVKASTAGRDCSLSALEKRLGDFTPARDPAPTRQLAPEPIEPAANGWKTYIVERQVHFESKTQQREQLRAQQRNRREEMLARHREERRHGLNWDWRGKRLELNTLRSMLAARQAQDKAELRERQQQEREMLHERFARWPTFEEWHRDRGRPELADEWRFRDRTPAGIVGDREDPARPRDIRAFTAQARGWEVRYHRAGSPDRAPCFSDHGREIRIHDLGRDSVLAALQLSAQKWGAFQVFGSDDYKRLCVELAAEHGFRIGNPELQGDIAKERGLPRPPAANRDLDVGPRAPTRAPVRDITEAYQRHLEDVRSAPEGRNVDASRLDGLVAARLRATGYAPDRVRAVIRTEASRARPDELRDWNAYARRVADHAFGRSGERHLRELVPKRELLLDIEGRGHVREPTVPLPGRRAFDLGR